MKLDDVNLRPQQRTFVTRFTEEPGRHLLVAPVGTGKMTAALIALTSLSRRAPAAAFIVTPSPVGENLLAQLRASGLPTQQITKRWLRAVADKGPDTDWPRTIVATVSPQLLHDPWVAREMSRMHWDAIVVDDAEANIAEPHLRRWLEALPVERVALLANMPSESLMVLSDSVTRWELDEGMGPESRVTAHVVSFERDAAEVVLLRRVASLVEDGSGQLRLPLEELNYAGRSSPFALQGAALQLLERVRPLRNALTHGRTGDQSEDARVEELGVVIRAQAELEAIVDAVDTLEHDARFQTLYDLVLNLNPSPFEPVRIFVGEDRTADYIVDRLRFLTVLAKTVRRGSGPDEVNAAPVSVVSDSALEGLALSEVRRTIFYDSSRDQAASAMRWRASAGDLSTEVWALVDNSPIGDDARVVREAPSWVDWSGEATKHRRS